RRRQRSRASHPPPRRGAGTPELDKNGWSPKRAPVPPPDRLDQPVGRPPRPPRSSGRPPRRAVEPLRAAGGNTRWSKPCLATLPALSPQSRWRQLVHARLEGSGAGVSPPKQRRLCENWQSQDLQSNALPPAFPQPAYRLTNQ